MTDSATPVGPIPLQLAANLDASKLLNASAIPLYGGIQRDEPVLVILAAGKGTRFGASPKCIQHVDGTPLARHSIDAFRRFSPSPAICIVGYKHDEVSSALGGDNIYIRSDNPAGGTGFATLEAFCVPDLAAIDPLLIITMGDRIVPSSIFRRLWEKHVEGGREADVTFLTAIYEPPRHRGKGRVLRDDNGRVIRIVEERDILNEIARQAMMNLTEGNCPLYVLRASKLLRHLQKITNANSQGQYYLTDVIQAIGREGGDLRTITTSPVDSEYDLLCSDVTQPMDLALLEGIVAAARGMLVPDELEMENAVEALTAGRPAGQIASIARQLSELLAASSREKLGFEPSKPVALGLSGGRLRIAFMHPDMQRFFGPAWQMPTGAGDVDGEEQIIVLVQEAQDRCLHLFPMNPKYRESINFISCESDAMYPSEAVSDLHAYEEFGTRMSERLLLGLGYFSDGELQDRRAKGLPLPPPTLWASSNMRRPFSLVGNSLASLRTVRTGNLGQKVQRSLGQENFKGLRLASTGNIPQGGFSSSSAVTVATKNGINALFDLGIPADLLVHLACQAEYGTGVRAGSLDQATEQKGRAGIGTLISSNPRDNYGILGTYSMPTDRIRILFPCSVDRDRMAWRWSWGAYAESPQPGHLTAGEMRKMTGKAAEIAALLVRLPLATDFFKQIEQDLVRDGLLSEESRKWVCSILLQLPLAIPQNELRSRVEANRDWYIDQLIHLNPLDKPDAASAAQKADATIQGLFAGWRDASLRSGTGIVEGVPLRSMVAYLFGEVAKNFHLIHHPEQWIECVRRSQRGDCCFDIDPQRLPDRNAMEGTLDWEAGATGTELLDRWLKRFGATPFDFNRDLDDASLSGAGPDFANLRGGNFFRGLALIDLAEAMLDRAFGPEATAVRVNAAGQGDYFQVHLDTKRVKPEDVKQFLRAAFYRRFDLTPKPEFVELHPGGGAVGLRLSRFEALSQLARRLGAYSAELRPKA
jgi:hypothetical protein